MVTEELGDVLDVRGLAAACASSGELEERLCELCVLEALGLVENGILVAYLGIEIIVVGLLGSLVEI